MSTWQTIDGSDALTKAKLLRQALRAELTRVEKFIADYEVFSSGRIPDAQPKRKCVKGQPEVIAEHIKEALVQAGTPLKRLEIVNSLEARGVPIPSNGDKCVYVGTILWRRPQQFRKLPDNRYELIAA